MVLYSGFNIFSLISSELYTRNDSNNTSYFKWFVAVIKNTLSKQLEGEHAYFCL